jgi:hypothetical protein
VKRSGNLGFHKKCIFFIYSCAHFYFLHLLFSTNVFLFPFSLLVSLPGAEEIDQTTDSGQIDAVEITKQGSDTVETLESTQIAAGNEPIVIDSVQLECVDEASSGEKSSDTQLLDNDIAVQKESVNASKCEVPVAPENTEEDQTPDGPADNDIQLKQQQSLDSYCSDSEDKPPLPLQTYLWEDIKRKKQQVI